MYCVGMLNCLQCCLGCNCPVPVAGEECEECCDDNVGEATVTSPHQLPGPRTRHT